MDKKRKKQRKKLILRISAILTAVWLILSCAYAAIAFHNEKNRAYHEARIAFSTWLKNTEPYTHNPVIFMDDVRKTAAIENSGDISDSEVSYTYDRNIEMVIQKVVGKDTFDTDDIINVSFTAETDHPEYREDLYGYLSYSRFRASMTDEQYEKILYYLDHQPQGDTRYELICTDFYHNTADELFPAAVQIVSTRDVNKWHVQDEPVETFQLQPKDVRWLDLRHISYLQRNVIPEEFVRNTFGSGGLVAQAQQLEQAKKEEMKARGEEVSNVTGLLQSDVFEYIYYDTDAISTRIPLSTSVIDLPESTAEQIEVDVPPTLFYSDTVDYVVCYAKRINIFDACIRGVAAATGLLFVFFLIIGTILTVLMWKSLKTQMLEEQKRRDMTNALAHDIKTPLFILSGYADNLKENVQNEKRDHYADVIVEQSQEINRRVNRMLELSKLDSPTLRLNKQKFDLAQLTEELLRNYETLPDGKTVDFCTDCTDGTCVIDADRELIKRAVENLTDNAVKYSDPDSVIRIRITDRTFSIANQCTRGDAKHPSGSGFGLSITRSILELHKFKGEYRTAQDTVCYTFRF